MTHDLRSPVWLEASIRYADDTYLSDEQIAQQLAANPELIRSLLCHVTASMSNRQLRETATNAENWMRDLILCEQEGELSENLQITKEATYLLLHTLKNSRTARSTFKNGSHTFRRQ